MAEIPSGSMIINNEKEAGSFVQYFIGQNLTQGQVEGFVQGGECILTYNVPQGKNLKIKNIAVSQDPKFKNSGTGAAANYIGYVRLYLNGNQFAELNLADTGFSSPSTSGAVNFTFYNGRFPASFFDVTLSAGDVIEARLLNNLALYNPDNCRVMVSIAGQGASGAILESTVENIGGKSNAVIEHDSTTIEKTFWTYTVPTGGLALKSLNVCGMAWDRLVRAFVTIKIMGRIVYENFMQADDYSAVFNILQLPLYNLSLGENQRVEVIISDPTLQDNSYTATIFGELEDIATGGGETSNVFLS